MLSTSSAICGWLADRAKSRRMPLLCGLLALAGATLLLCLGRSTTAMLIGRILQGASAAVVWTVGLALMADTVRPTEIGQMVAWVSLSLTLAELAGPLLGGIVFNKGGYFPVFYMSFGMIIIDIILRAMLVEKKIAKQWLFTEEPPPVNDVSLPFQSPTINPIAETPQLTNGKPSPLKNRYPIMILLSSRRLWSALWLSLFQCVLLTAFEATLPLRVAEVFHWNSLGAGLVFLASALTTFSAPLVGMFVDSYGPRLPAVLGFLFATIPLVLLLLINHSGLRQIVFLCALLALLGLALTTAMVPLMAEITYSVSAQEKRHPGVFGERGAYAQAYGIWNCAFAGGVLIGPLWGGFVRDRAGWSTMCWSLGVLSAVCVVPAALWTGGWIFDRTKRQDRHAAAGERKEEGGAAI